MIDNITQEKQSTDSKDPSMAQILQTIRGVITEDQQTVLTPAVDDVLELDKSFEVKPKSNVVENSPQKAVQNEAQNTAPNMTPSTEQNIDILNNIDSVLSQKDPAKTITTQEHAETNAVQTASDTQPSELNAVGTPSSEPEAVGKTSQLLSPESAQETAQSLRTLMKSVAKPASDGLAFRGGTTVEDLVTELMKPYLKEWLDKNLPTIVKQIVEKEIHKLIPQEDD